MATRLNADGTTATVLPANGRSFTLPELQAIVGGYVETFTVAAGLLWMNEDGKRLSLPFNRQATILARQAGLPPWDQICGDVLLADRSEVR